MTKSDLIDYSIGIFGAIVITILAAVFIFSISIGINGHSVKNIKINSTSVELDGRVIPYSIIHSLEKNKVKIWNGEDTKKYQIPKDKFNKLKSSYIKWLGEKNDQNTSKN